MKQKLKSYGIVALGALLIALSVDCFFASNQLNTGGVTGLALIVNALFPRISVGTASFAVNLPLFLIGWKLLGFHMLASSLFCVTVLSVSVDVMMALWPVPPMDPMLAALFGGAVMGLGVGFIFSQGATSGGSSILARLLRLKFPWLPLGTLMLVPDFIILAMSAAVFGRFELILYSVVSLYVSAKVTDMVLYGLDTSKVAYIVSNRWHDITDVLLQKLNRGVTLLRGEGAYTGEEKRVLLVAFKQKEIVEIKRVVHSIDPGAFLIVCDAHDVLGEGFGEYQKEEF